ncbi:MAG: ribonuclease P protein component [Ezakiella massiliensis]
MLAKENRLKKKEDFSSLYKRSNFKANRVFKIRYRRGVKRVGIVVSNKHGKANIRNKLKRRIRAIMREQIPNMENYDIIITPKIGASDLSYSELSRNLLHVLRLGGIIK